MKLELRKLVVARRKRKHRPIFFALCAVVGLALAWPLRAQQSSPAARSPQMAPNAVRQTLTILDGTPIQLRFAQPVRGVTRARWGRVSTEAQPGDKIRLVVGEAIHIDGLVVVSKGAIGQATVNNVWLPVPTYDRHGNKTTLPQTGLSLRLDWVEDVAGQQVLLRASPLGEPKPFTVEVLSKDGGAGSATGQLAP